MVKIFTDGGARGNPGPAAIGVYIVDEKDNKIFGFGKKIGFATNNVAEYTAVIEALSWALENKNVISNKTLKFYLDSNLVVSQLRGLFKIKNAKLRELLFKIREQEAALNLQIEYFHIPREENKIADTFVNDALDNKL